MNAAACDLAQEVADGGAALVAGGICQTSLYKYHKDETRIKNIFRLQLGVFARKNVDFLIAEVRLVLEGLDWVALYLHFLCVDAQWFRLTHYGPGNTLPSAWWVLCEARDRPVPCLSVGFAFEVTDLGDNKVRKRRGQRLRIYPFPQKPGWKAWGRGGESRGAMSSRKMAAQVHQGSLVILGTEQLPSPFAFFNAFLLLLGLAHINGNLKKRTDTLCHIFIVTVAAETKENKKRIIWARGFGGALLGQLALGHIVRQNRMEEGVAE